MPTKVKAAILNAPSLKSAQVNVETFKGTVQLSSFVNSRADINKATEAAWLPLFPAEDAASTNYF